MTDVDPNTFPGPNQGNTDGYIPYTTIDQSKVDADFNNIKTDLDKLLTEIQSIYSKLDTIETGATADQDALEIISVINASDYQIDVDNLDGTVVVDSELTNAIAAHKNTTTESEMHPETSIKNTGLTYSNTPTALKSSCANLLDEIKNIRFQIHRLNGKTNWTDVPDSDLTTLLNDLQSLTSDLSTHAANMDLHLDGSEPWKTPLIQTTVSYTLQNTDYTVTCDTTSNDIIITLPDASTVSNKIYNVKKVDNSANSVIIDGNGAQTIDGEETRTIVMQYESITVQSNGTNWVII